MPRTQIVAPVGQYSLCAGTGAWLGLWKPDRTISSEPSLHAKQLSRLSTRDLKSLIIVILIASAVRLFDLRNPPNAVFEEAVMGGYVNRYINGNFFLDFEPPLPGLIYYLIAILSGYKGTFQFKSENESFVGEPFPFALLRFVAAAMGVLSIALTYMILKLHGVTRTFAATGACLVIFENSLVTEFRHFFPRPFLYFFYTLALYSWRRLELESGLSWNWWSWGIITSLSMSSAAVSRDSGKYLVILLWGLNLYRTWWIGVDMKITRTRVFKQFVSRMFLFFVIPVVFYMGTIMLHLRLMPNSGDGDIFMPGSFQAGLVGNERPSIAANVSLGSLVTIRHYETFAFLHSHEKFYPSKSRQQQVTLYGYKDLNNVWLIEDQAYSSASDPHTSPPTVIRSNEYIRLKHVNTNRHLHSHDVKAPVSDVDWQFEVSGYGADGYPGDLNDIWRVEIIDSYTTKQDNHGVWRSIQSVVRFQHAVLGCYLFSHRINLPQWGSNQLEVTCAKRGVLRNSLWVVETNYHPLYTTDPKEYISYEPLSIMEKVAHYTDAMVTAGKTIFSNPVWQEPAWKVPFLVRGTNMYWKHHRQVFIMGNPVVWGLACLTLISYFVFKIAVAMMVQRGYKQKLLRNLPNVVQFDHNAGQFAFGWLVHFMPLCFRQSRGVTITDYLPALYCSILMFAVSWDYAAREMNLRRKTVSGVSILVLISTVYMFILYTPLTYGQAWYQKECVVAEKKDWGFYCQNYLQSPDDYATYDKDNDGVIFQSRPIRIETVSDTNIYPPDRSARGEGILALEEFEGIQYIKPQELDLGNPQVRDMMVQQIHSRGMSLEEYEENPAVGDQVREQVLNETYSRSVQAQIDSQWSRITDPPQIAEGDELASKLGLKSTIRKEQVISKFAESGVAGVSELDGQLDEQLSDQLDSRLLKDNEMVKSKSNKYYVSHN